MKLLKKFQSLSWYNQLLILVLTVALCFYLFKTYLVLILIVASIICLKLLWRIIFCRAKQTEKGVEFNLSRFAEIVLMLFFVLMAILMGYGIYTSSSPWYGYIFPIIVLFVQFASVIQVWSNRNDFIRIKDNIISFKDNGKEGSIEFKSLGIEERKTEAFEFKMSGDATGPFLIAIDQQNQEHAFDLKMMNLNGHVHALKTYLNTINKDEVN
jgi:hypothetical protein